MYLSDLFKRELMEGLFTNSRHGQPDSQLHGNDEYCQVVADPIDAVSVIPVSDVDGVGSFIAEPTRKRWVSFALQSWETSSTAHIRANSAVDGDGFAHPDKTEKPILKLENHVRFGIINCFFHCLFYSSFYPDWRNPFIFHFPGFPR